MTNLHNSQFKSWAATVTVMGTWHPDLKIPQAFRDDVFVGDAFLRKLGLCFVNRLKRMSRVALFALEFLIWKEFVGFASCDELGSCFQTLRTLVLTWKYYWESVIGLTFDAFFDGSIVFVPNAMIFNEVCFDTDFVHSTVFQSIPTFATITNI